MSILARLKKNRGEAPPTNTPDCAHWELGPRWANAADIGNRSLITSYSCSTCGRSFTPAEVAQRAN